MSPDRMAPPTTPLARSQAKQVQNRRVRQILHAEMDKLCDAWEAAGWTGNIRASVRYQNGVAQLRIMLNDREVEIEV